MQLVEPAGESVDGPFRVFRWPAVDAQSGMVAMRMPFEVESGAPYLRNGWQSWSAPTFARFGSTRSRAPVRARPHVGRRHRFDGRSAIGDESYDVLIGGGQVAGVVEHGALLVARPHQRDLLAIVEAPGPYPDVYVAARDDRATVDALLARARGRVPTHLPTGWCSWYGFYEHFDERALVNTIADLPTHCEVVQVDDAWQRTIGDWHSTSDAFPSGRRAIAQRIANAGRRPGVWLAPFVVARDSVIASRRQQWLLRDGRGAPVVAMRVPHWGGDTYALDVTRADVLSWLHDLAAALVADGFSYLKLDFLYAAALAGERAVKVSGHTAMRNALTAIRAGAGDDTFLLGCGSPLWPAIGLVDAMRVGPDVGAHWVPPSVGGVDQRSISCLDNTWRAARLRAMFHGALWANDPDCVLLRRRNTRLHASERIGWARWVARSGQLFVDGDRLMDLNARDYAFWEELATVGSMGPIMSAKLLA